MTHLQAGTKAPDFSGLDQDGKRISLKDLKGKKVVLYFYPADMTETCTIQACNLRDSYSDLKKAGFEVIGVSPDSSKKHKKFEEKYDLPFRLLEDPSHTIIDKYDVWGEKQLYGRTYLGLHRTSFVIDEMGIIRLVITKPKSKIHAEEILAAWNDL
jgi:peroxiredoxin Q/BCP